MSKESKNWLKVTKINLETYFLVERHFDRQKFETKQLGTLKQQPKLNNIEKTRKINTESFPRLNPQWTPNQHPKPNGHYKNKKAVSALIYLVQRTENRKSHVSCGGDRQSVLLGGNTYSNELDSSFW